MSCTNKHKGSDWQGEVNNITDHPKTTLEVNCSNGELWSDNIWAAMLTLSVHVIHHLSAIITGELQFVNGQEKVKGLKQGLGDESMITGDCNMWETRYWLHLTTYCCRNLEKLYCCTCFCIRCSHSLTSNCAHDYEFFVANSQ